MKYTKRSTVIGAALIFTGILAGILAGHLLRGGTQDIPLHTTAGGQKETTGAQIPAGPAPVGVLFTAADRKFASLRYGSDCAYRPDMQSLLEQKLSWDLSGTKPTVLIVHTHASESYTKAPGQDYQESSEYRTLETQYNMVALGDRLAALLHQAGISVLHDRSLHDYPSYNASYTNSRTAVETYLQAYPDIQVVLDLHRDAALLSDGSQFAPTVEANGKKVAQLMLVVGSDASGTVHPHWQENLAAALKLQVLLEKAQPGLTRPTLLRAQRYNQDLSGGALIVEIGAAGNTLEEAMAAVPYLADAIAALRYGTAEEP